MKRKIMQIADTTFVVSLPLKWAREHNLKKGDEVELVAEKNQLCLRFENTIDKKSYSVDVQEYNRMAGRYIVSLYRLGYDEIEVKFSDPNYVSKIPKELFENTIGFEVISQKLNSCIIKNLSESDDEELENIIKRLWFLLKEMSKDLVEAIKNKDKTTLKSMKEREKTINKFSNYCIRLL
ncbi:MAG: AbrB/MazE/SpoVT family DNA-binding domain-containing protein [Candidatus Woesearchaeota archaeon]